MIYNSVAYKVNDKIYIGTIEDESVINPPVTSFYPSESYKDEKIRPSHMYVMMVDMDMEAKHIEMFPLEEVPMFDDENNALDLSELEDEDILNLSNNLLKRFKDTATFH